MEDYIKIRVEQGFKNQLQERAKKLGLSLSAYVRLKLSEILLNPYING